MRLVHFTTHQFPSMDSPDAPLLVNPEHVITVKPCISTMSEIHLLGGVFARVYGSLAEVADKLDPPA